MKYLVSLLFFALFHLSSAYAGSDVEGFWKSMDEKTGKPTSIVAVYEYKGRYYGRLVATYNDQTGILDESIYNPTSRAKGVKGHPYYDGLDFIWDLEKEGNKYVNGLIMDPKAGRLYQAEMWRDGENLIVRGEILFLGRNQVWPPAKKEDLPADFVLPDTSKFVPVIPEAATDK